MILQINEPNELVCNKRPAEIMLSPVFNLSLYLFHCNACAALKKKKSDLNEKN